MSPELETQLQALLDENAIVKALTRYTRGIDRHEEALIESAFHPDGVDHHGDGMRGPQELSTWGNDLHSAHTRSHQHFLANPTIELDGERAHSEVYVLFVLWKRNEPSVDISGGRYIDRWEKRDGDWGIVERVVVVDWTAEAPQGTDTKGTLASYAGGSWGPEDPSYRRPLTWNAEASAETPFGRLLHRDA